MTSPLIPWFLSSNTKGRFCQENEPCLTIFQRCLHDSASFESLVTLLHFIGIEDTQSREMKLMLARELCRVHFLWIINSAEVLVNYGLESDIVTFVDYSDELGLLRCHVVARTLLTLLE